MRARINLHARDFDGGRNRVALLVHQTDQESCRAGLGFCRNCYLLLIEPGFTGVPSACWKILVAQMKSFCAHRPGRIDDLNLGAIIVCWFLNRAPVERERERVPDAKRVG